MKSKQIGMQEIDYTKVTANDVMLDCKKCKGHSTVHGFVFVNEDGEAVAFDGWGCYICELN